MNDRKTLLRVCALLIAALMLSGCSAVISNPVVGKVGDVEITYSQFYSLFDSYSSYGLVDTSTAEALAEARTSIFNMLVDSTLPIAAAHKQGLTLTEEEKAAALEQAASTMQNYLSKYQDETVADEAARTAAAIKAFNKAYKANGITYESVKKETEQAALDAALGNKLTQQVKATAAAATDADAQTWYDAQLKTEREKYAADATAYYQDNQYYSYSGAVKPLVAPEGLFYVKHILIKTEDPADTSAESGEDGETVSSDSVSFGDPKAAAASILEKVNAGEDFDALIEEYGEDPGMQAEPAKTQGYVIGEGYDAVYDQAFYDAAMKLKKTGDTSGVVEGSYGYHIIRRVGDVSTEPIPFADVQEDIITYLNNKNQSDAYNAALEQWKSEIDVKFYEKRVSYVGLG
ncbi:MAG: peptidylprolyl isomerase [Candidatus Pelethousia sp.]|nr:peptidylprolyl isomerase [Candidatus Pelethousia sp.]